MTDQVAAHTLGQADRVMPDPVVHVTQAPAELAGDVRLYAGNVTRGRRGTNAMRKPILMMLLSVARTSAVAKWVEVASSDRGGLP